VKEKRMRNWRIFFAAMVVVIAASCTTRPPLRKGEILIEDKGTTYGIKTPKWVELAVVGNFRDIEKLSDFKDKTVFIAQFEAQNLQSAQLLAERMQADTEIARYLSTRVKDAFKGANVADADSKHFGAYGERFVVSVGQAKFSGFRMEADWWVKVQTYTPENRPDKQVYRVIQLWTIDRAMLQRQFDIIIAQLTETEQPTEEQRRAIDLVQRTAAKDFFGEDL
jgi:hypothetical protein